MGTPCVLPKPNAVGGPCTFPEEQFSPAVSAPDVVAPLSGPAGGHETPPAGFIRAPTRATPEETEFDESELGLSYQVGVTSAGARIEGSIDHRMLATGEFKALHLTLDPTRWPRFSLDPGRWEDTAVDVARMMGVQGRWNGLSAGVSIGGQTYVGLGQAVTVGTHGVGIGPVTVHRGGVSLVSGKSALILAGVVVLDGILRGRSADGILSETAPKLVPVNTARELIAFFRFAWGSPPAHGVKTPGMNAKQAERFLRSYEKQELVYTALMHIDHMIAENPGPVWIALLKERQDVLLTQTCRAIPVASRRHEGFRRPGTVIEARIAEAVASCERFSAAHVDWLAGHEWARKPEDAEIDAYLAQTLYLAQKLSLTVKSKTEDGHMILKVLSSSPWHLTDPRLGARYLKTVVSAYEYLVSPRSTLLEELSRRARASRERFAKHLADPRATDMDCVAAYGDTSTSRDWLGAMAMLLPAFSLRQKHIRWKTSRLLEGDARTVMLRKMDIASPDTRAVKEALGGFSGTTRPMSRRMGRLMEAVMEALEKLDTLSGQPPAEDLVDIVHRAAVVTGQVVERGLDLEGVRQDWVSLENGFASMVRILVSYRAMVRSTPPTTQTDTEDRTTFRAAFARAQRSLETLVRTRPRELDWRRNHLQERIDGDFGVLADRVRGLAHHAEDLSAHMNLIHFILEKDARVREAAGESLEMAITLARPLVVDLATMKTRPALRREAASDLTAELDASLGEAARVFAPLDEMERALTESRVALLAAIEPLQVLAGNETNGMAGSAHDGARKWLEDVNHTLETIRTIRDEARALQTRRSVLALMDRYLPRVPEYNF